MELRKYIQPQVEIIKLDNQISLALESDAPVGPNEVYLKVPEYFTTDAFKHNIG